MSSRRFELPKLCTLILIVPLLFSVGSAVNVTENKWTNTTKPGTQVSKTFHISVAQNETVTVSNKGVLLDISPTYFPQNGSYTFEATFPAMSSGNYSGKILVKGNNTVKIPVHFTVKIPYKNEWGPFWVNKSNYFLMNGKRYNITAIKHNLYLNKKKVSTGKTKNLNGIDFKVIDLIPNEYAKVKAKSKKSDSTFKIKHQKKKKKKKEKGCKLGLQTVGTMTFSRGSYFFAHTINMKSKNKERVTNVEVTIRDLGRKKKPYIAKGVVSSSLTGKINVWIPEDVVGPFTASLRTTPDSNIKCEPSDIQVKPGVPYGEYKKNNPSFQLKLKLDKKRIVNKKIKGKVSNREGESVKTGFIKITKPDGSKTDIMFHNSTFSFDPSKPGNYTFKATKTKYVPSQKVTATYITDSDKDGTPDDVDHCPDEKGVKILNGCPKMSPHLTVYDKNGNRVHGLTTGKTYTIELTYEKNRINYSGDIKIGGNSYEIREGVRTFKPSEEGRYKIKFGGTDRYKSTAYKVNVKKPQFNWRRIGMVVVGVLLVIGLIWFAKKGLEKGGGREVPPPGKPKEKGGEGVPPASREVSSE